MKKKAIFGLLLIITLLITAIPVFSLSNFTISSIEFYSVTENFEIHASEVASGIMRAKVQFSSTTNEEQVFSVYLCSKDSKTGRLKAINAQNYTVSSPVSNAVCTIDINVEDNKKENLFLYVWDKNNSPLCEPAVLKCAKTSFTVNALLTETYMTYPSLATSDGKGKIRLKLYEEPTEEDLSLYKNYTEFTHNEGSSSLNMKFDVLEGDSFAHQYTGCYVIAELSSNEEGSLEIISITPDTNKSSILTVSKDIETADVDSAGNVIFEYWEDIDTDSEPTKVGIAEDAMVSVNGARVGNLDSEDAMLAFKEAVSADSVTFIGAKGEDFNTILITEYQYGIVKEINNKEESIELNNCFIELGESVRSGKFVCNFYKNGNKISLSDIKENDVLSIFAPNQDIDNGNYINFYVSDDVVEGTVTNAKTGAQNYTYTINNKEYKTVYANSLKVGDEGIFYLTHNGKIIDFYDLYVNNYAYILNVTTDSMPCSLTLLTKKGNKVTYSIASSVSVTDEIDGEIVTTTLNADDGKQDSLYDKIAEILSADAIEEIAQEKAAMRLITYSLSENDEIDRISFASANGEEGYDYNVKFTEGSYRAATSRLGGYYFTESTSLFYAPVGKIAEDSYGIATDDVTLLNFALLDEDQNYTAYAYSVEDKTMGAALIVNSLGFLGKDTHLAVVSGVSTGMNADGEETVNITVLQSGQKTTYIVDERIDTLDDIAEGDIIQFVIKEDEIYQAEVVYNDSLTVYAKSVTQDSSDISFIKGWAVDGGSGYIYLNDELSPSGSQDYVYNCNDTSTLALINEAKAGAASYVKALDSTSAVKYISSFNDDGSPRGDIYYIVARLDDGDIVDVVEYTGMVIK